MGGRHVYTDPNVPLSSFTSLVRFIDQLAPGSVGQTNHQKEFMIRFGRCMAIHFQLCIAAQHWAKVPALHMPSDFARVIDGYTVDSEPCLLVVHVITTETGELQWLLIDVVPNARSAIVSGSSDRLDVLL